LISGLISAIIDEMIQTSIKPEFKDKLKEINIADKHLHSMNVSTIFDIVSDSILEEKFNSKVTSKIEEIWKIPEGDAKPKFNFFDDILDKQEDVSEDQDLSGSCSCDAPDCECKGASKADYHFDTKKHKKYPKLKSHTELKQISADCKSKTRSKKRPVTVNDDDEDFASGDIVILSEDKDAKIGKAKNAKSGLKVKADVDVKADSKLEVKADAKVDVEVDAKVDVKADVKASSKSEESKSEESKSEESKSEESKSEESSESQSD